MLVFQSRITLVAMVLHHGYIHNYYILADVKVTTTTLIIYSKDDAMGKSD